MNQGKDEGDSCSSFPFGHKHITVFMKEWFWSVHWSLWCSGPYCSDKKWRHQLTYHLNVLHYTCLCLFLFSNYLLTSKPYSFSLLASQFWDYQQPLNWLSFSLWALSSSFFPPALGLTDYLPWNSLLLTSVTPPWYFFSHFLQWCNFSALFLISSYFPGLPASALTAVTSLAQTYCFASLIACWISLPSNDHSNDLS